MVLTFDDPFHDFGRVKKGEKVSHIYSFKNEGSEDIVIDIVSGCECSTLTYDEGKTYKPGDSGEIKVVFDSKDESGKVEKVIEILLQNIDPKTGYQYFFELKYGADVYE